jgi:phosphate transport system permease protein
MSQLSPSPAVPEPVLRRRSSAGWLHLIDWLVQGTAASGAFLMIGLLVMLLIVVGIGAWPAMQKLGLAFLWNTRWSVVRKDFGAWPLIYGTLLTSFFGMAIAIPISLGSAVFLTKLAPAIHIPIGFTKNGIKWAKPRTLVSIVSFLIELLAAIPSIAYGLWGVFVLAPFMQHTVQPLMDRTIAHAPLIGSFFVDDGLGGNNMLTASIILSIMVTPIMTAIIRDVLAVAPPELEQGALGLGATWWQATRLVLGFSKMGILGAIILGFARAIGETMAVTMVIGNSIDMDKTITSPGYTIASILANQFNNADTNAEKHALVYAAFVLLVITTLINGIARVMVMRVAAKGKRR